MLSLTQDELKEILEYSEIYADECATIDGKTINCFDTLYPVLSGKVHESCITKSCAIDYVNQLELIQLSIMLFCEQRDHVLDKVIKFLQDIQTKY